LQLTEEQRDIVTHYQGAAIVYAVAGAGKSTTMAYRVQHLVNTHGVDPQRILVCSFSKATVNDIQQKIANLGVPRVACYTFNALGRKIVQKAVQDGFFTAFDEEHIEHRNSQLAMRALVELGKQYGKNFSQLDINQEDLQTYISVCKGNLCYANILAAKLPPHTLAYAEQAEHKNAHYLKAYQLYEQIRQQHNWLTFDDQLVLAWEALERFDSIRAWAKNSFDFVLIDEFQDVNKVQVQIADILTEDHRNYMAIGDDDQCIYEWRGADVRYILDFKKRYQAQAYIISDNFRCPAEATLLAGKVIAQNKERQPKDLVSQKGFGGGVVLQGFKNEEDSAQYVVNCYKNLLTQGTHPKDCIVLVRTYSQTSVIEAKLIQEELAYQVIGNQRFYERAEVKVLFTYLSFARQERDYQQSDQHQTLSEQYIRRFAEVLRHPNRYLSQQWINDFMMQARQQNGSLVIYLAQQFSQVPHQTAQNRLAKLVSILQKLQAKLDEDAGLTLLWLVNELEYLDALKKAAAIPELGEERCQNVRALINYAQKKGTVLQFLEHLRRLHLSDSQSNDTQPKLQIMSIHRAKGLEWPVVFVPCCSKEQMPSVYNDNIEEERRLLYVALTRTKQQLHILYAPQEAMSVFLKQVRAPEILNTANQLANIFNPHTLDQVTPQDIALLAQSLASYPLVRYIQKWWRVDSITLALLQQKISDALRQQTQALEQVAQAQLSSLNEIHQSKTHEQQLKSMERRLLLFAKRPVSVLLQKKLTTSHHHLFSFVAQPHAIEVYVASGQCVGCVDLKGSKFPVSEVLDWSWLEGVITSEAKSWQGGQKISLRLRLRHDIKHTIAPTLSAQSSVLEKTQYMASPLFNQDIAYLSSILRLN
jgi:DNA helicase-2/ATP-dependent DNA helicase PcrA